MGGHSFKEPTSINVFLRLHSSSSFFPKHSILRKKKKHTFLPFLFAALESIGVEPTRNTPLESRTIIKHSRATPSHTTATTQSQTAIVTTMFRSSTHLPRTIPRLAAAVNPTRRFLQTTRPVFAAKNTQDKDSLNPQSNEYSKSGSDQDTASSSAAFDPSTTSPEGEEKQAENEAGGNSLKVSPAQDKVSKPRGDQEGGAQGSPRTSASGGGSAPKSGGAKSG